MSRWVDDKSSSVVVQYDDINLWKCTVKSYVMMIDFWCHQISLFFLELIELHSLRTWWYPGTVSRARAIYLVYLLYQVRIFVLYVCDRVCRTPRYDQHEHCCTCCCTYEYVWATFSMKVWGVSLALESLDRGGVFDFSITVLLVRSFLLHYY